MRSGTGAWDLPGYSNQDELLTIQFRTKDWAAEGETVVSVRRAQALNADSQPMGINTGEGISLDVFTLWGDANRDGSVNMGDSDVLWMHLIMEGPLIGLDNMPTHDVVDLRASNAFYCTWRI